MITIKQIVGHLEQVAPKMYQESYDNAGLIVGDMTQQCTGVITCLDSTEAVIEEAISKGCNLVVAHHPIVFKGLKRFNGSTYVQRVIMLAIRNNIAIYAIHTNLDNVYARGVNAKIAERLGLVSTRILAPKANLIRASVFTSDAFADELKGALQKAASSAQSPPVAIRQWKAKSAESNDIDVQLELVFAKDRARAVQTVLIAYPAANAQYTEISNPNELTGSGLVGELPQPLPEKGFLRQLKEQMGVSCIKYTALLDQTIQTVALCGGSGGFLLPQAIAAGAQIFITADYKYHEFFDADGKIVIADIGHYESEQFTIELLAEVIREKFGNFAVHLTEVNTNPVNYL